MSGDEEAQEVAAAEEPVLRPVSVDLPRDADDGHGRLEGGDERQRHGETAHTAVRHQELLRGALPPPRQRVVQSDGQRGGEEKRKDPVVQRSKTLLKRRVHRVRDQRLETSGGERWL